MKKFLVLMAAACLMAACGEQKAERSLHSVMTVKPERASEATEKNFSGVVKENAETSLGFRTGGTIEQVLVKEGDHVRKGQLLARLDAKDYQLQVNAVQIQYDQLKAEVERLRLLYEGKSLAGNDYEKAVSGLEQLGVQLQANKNQLSYTRLYAPCDGYVQSVSHERAEMVGAGTPVVTLLDVRRMEVEVSIPKSVYQQRGQFAGIHCTADGQQYPLHLINIVPKANSSQLYTARLSLTPSPSFPSEARLPVAFPTGEGSSYQQLSAGQSVDVCITIQSTPLSSRRGVGGEAVGGEASGASSFSLPLSSIFEHEGQSCVWVIGQDSTVTAKPISVAGTDANGRAIVTSGLQGDETIVRAGVHALHEKDRVRIISETSKTNVGGLI